MSHFTFQLDLSISESFDLIFLQIFDSTYNGSLNRSLPKRSSGPLFFCPNTVRRESHFSQEGEVADFMGGASGGAGGQLPALPPPLAPQSEFCL